MVTHREKVRGGRKTKPIDKKLTSFSVWEKNL